MFSHAVLPVLGAVADVYLLTKLSHTAVLLGLAWLALGIVHLCVLTRGLGQEPPELHPEETSREETPVTAR